MAEQTAIRPVKYGIGMKFGLFIALILVATMIVVGFFVVRGQQRALEKSLQESMTSALLGYRALIRRNLTDVIKADEKDAARIRGEAFSRIRKYTWSLTNIRNCEQVMFVEGASTGRVFADSAWSGPRYWSPMTPTRMVDEDARRQYGSIDFFITDMIDNREPYFVDSETVPGKVRINWIRNRNNAISNWNARVRKINEGRRAKNIPLLNESPYIPDPAPQGLSEGFLQVYINYHRLLFPGAKEDYLENGLGLYHSWKKRNFDFKGIQSDDRRLGLRFVQLVERATALFYTEKKVNGRITGLEQTAFGKILAARKTEGIPLTEQIWLYRFSRRLDSYRDPDVGGLLAALKAVRAFLSRFPDLKSLADRFPEPDLYSGDVLERIPVPGKLPGEKSVPAQFRYAYRIHRNRYRQAFDRVLRPGKGIDSGSVMRAGEILKSLLRNPAALRAVRVRDAGRLADAAVKGKLFRAGLTTREALEIHTAKQYIDISDLFYGSDMDPAWEKALRRLAPYYAYRAGAVLPVPFYRDSEVGVHLKFFGQYFRRYLETGVFPRKYPRDDRFEFIRLSRTRKNGRAYRAAGTEEERAAFFRHVLRVSVLPFKVGFVRIMLGTHTMRADQDLVTFRTADLGISLVLRMVFFSFLLSGLFVRNIRRLADAARRVGKGDLETRIDLDVTDELGQLADQFNVMVGEIKESQVQLMEKSRMEEELKIAEQIQQRLLPETFPEAIGISFAGYYNAMTEAGGDYYDVIEVAEGVYGLVSADVSGHGVGAGLVMTMMRSVLHAQAPGMLQAQTVLRKINPQLYRDTPMGVFVTALYGVLDVAKRELSYASAGHDPCIIYNKEKGICRFLEAEGVPLGMFDQKTFEGILKGYKLKLSPGDTVVFYTDGVTEAMNADREEFQDERLAQSVNRHGGKTPEELVAGIVEDVKAFTGGLPQEDDISLLVFRVE